jgi:ribosomal protein S18 acetylase RimI-like enzyme
MASNQALTTDTWLSAAMKVNCVRVSARDASAADLATLRTSKTFAFAKVNPLEIAAAAELQRNGFYLVDTNVQLELDSLNESTRSARFSIRMAARNEPEQVVRSIARIAETAFDYTRFHLDPKVPKQVANHIKGSWVLNYFLGGRGDQLVVAEGESGAPVGFLLALKTKDRTVIDLIATDRTAQGQGAGSEMIRALARANPGPISVGTQLANVPSLQFYQSLGFRVSGASYVFHFHSEAI